MRRLILWLWATLLLVQELRGAVPELLAPDRFGEVLAALKSSGAEPPDTGIVSVGYDIREGVLFVITLPAGGTPQKWSLSMTDSTFRVLIGSPSSAPLAEAPAPAASPSGRQDGRVYFMSHTMGKSFYVYPYGLAVAFPNLDGQVLTGLTLLFGGGSLYGSYLFTKDRKLGYGRVALLNYGGELGTVYPLLLELALRHGTDIDDRGAPSSPYTPNPGSTPSEKIGAWGRMAGFPLGIYAGSRARVCGNDQFGNASMMVNFSRWGWMYGWMLPAFGDGGGWETYATTSSLLTMAFLPAGFYLGYRITRGEDYSSGRSFLVLTTGTMGSLTGLLFPTLFEAEGRRIYLTSTMAGHLLGTAFGFHFKRGKPYTFGQGLFMALSATGGAAVALSFPLITQSDNHQLYTIMGLAGAWGGLAVGEHLAQSIFETSEKDRRSASRLEFPVLWQWPLLIATALEGKGTSTVDIFRAGF